MAISCGDLPLPMFQDTLEMLALVRTSFRGHDPAALDLAAALGRTVHKQEKDLTERLLAAAPEAAGIRFAPAHLERIGDAAEGLIRVLRTMEAEGTVFTDRGLGEIDQLFGRAIELVECARDLTLTGNAVLARHLEIESMRFHDLASDFARAHEERLIEGVCMPKASSAYLAMLDHLREITRHARRIGSRVKPPGPPQPLRVGA